jgi:hypothetical protein
VHSDWNSYSLILEAGSIGKALNIASCENAHGSFDVWSLIKKAGRRLAAAAFRGDHAISGVVPSR